MESFRAPVVEQPWCEASCQHPEAWWKQESLAAKHPNVAGHRVTADTRRPEKSRCMARCSEGHAESVGGFGKLDCGPADTRADLALQGELGQLLLACSKMV